MKLNFKASEPGNIQLELTATMSLDEWITIKEQLKKSEVGPSHSGNALIASITDVVIQANEHFQPENKE